MEFDNYCYLPTKLLAKAEAMIDVFSCYMYEEHAPPEIWGLRIDHQFLNFGFLRSNEVKIWSHAETLEAMDGDALSSLAYTFDLRSGHIGKNVALWLLREARTVFGHELSMEARELIDVLAWDLQRQGASVDNICFTSVLEIVRYETCMRSVFEKLPTGKKHIPHQKLRSLQDGMRNTSIGRASFGELAHVADVLFGLCGDISCVGGGEPELEKLARGKFVESRHLLTDHEVTMYTIALWSEYVKLL
jgi:hypothetical protein